MKNLNDLLAGRDAAQHFLAQRFFFDARDEILGDLKINIRFQQREPHLPHRIIDVRLADRAMPAQILEDVLKLIAELRKHNEISVPPAPLIFSSSSLAPEQAGPPAAAVLMAGPMQSAAERFHHRS